MCAADLLYGVSPVSSDTNGLFAIPYGSSGSESEVLLSSPRAAEPLESTQHLLMDLEEPSSPGRAGRS